MSLILEDRRRRRWVSSSVTKLIQWPLEVFKFTVKISHSA
uniref:Uncharacterized protein n=1 Tax=Anguilla anguilla TaxID=7936 RepID=A0A0E9UNI6_ANGAN